MRNHPRIRLVESPAERRGRLESDEPGEMVFTSQLAYVEAMQARVRRATVRHPDAPGLKQKDIAAQGEMSPSTVGNMASGKTHYPRFSTMFGIAAALGVEVVLRPRTVLGDLRVDVAEVGGDGAHGFLRNSSANIVRAKPMPKTSAIWMSRQEIAKHRVWISELEDTRIMLMQREEHRATMNGHPSPFGTLPGAEIAVRERALLEEGVQSRALKEGTPVLPGLNAAGNRRGMVKNPKGNKGGSHNLYKVQVVNFLKANRDSQFNLGAIIDRLGIGPMKGKEKQPLYQALYELKKTGVVISPNGTGTYQWAMNNATPQVLQTPTP